jgi:hypothetical protein
MRRMFAKDLVGGCDCGCRGDSTLLRRINTEVGDGGYGPEGGLASLTPRRVPHWHVPDWHCATTIHANRAEWGAPASWFFLTDGGCTMEWYVSLIAVDRPVLLWDADGWEPDWVQDAHDGLRYAGAIAAPVAVDLDRQRHCVGRSAGTTRLLTFSGCVRVVTLGDPCGMPVVCGTRMVGA